MARYYGGGPFTWYTYDMEIIDQIRRDMLQAMKSKNALEANQLKSLLARISNAEAVPITSDSSLLGRSAGVGSTEAPRRALTADDIQTIIIAEKDEIETTLAQLDVDSDYARALRQKHEIVQRYTDK